MLITRELHGLHPPHIPMKDEQDLIDPQGDKALAFKESQDSRRAERQAHRRKVWEEYDTVYVLGGLAIGLFVLGYMVLAFTRLGGSWF